MEHDTSNQLSHPVRRHTYPISLKKQVVALRDCMSIREIGDHLGVHYSNVRNWVRVANKLSDFKRNKKSSNVPGAGRPPILPQPDALLEFMDTPRHQERALTWFHMVNFLKKHQQQWLQTYIERQADGCGYDNLLRLLERFSARHGYTYQQACTAKRTITDLKSTRVEFAVRFCSEHRSLPDDCVYNVDETGIQYDMPPRYIWSKIGGTPKLSKGEKHSYPERVTGRSLLVLDNFDAHVSEEGVDTAAEIGYDVCPLPPNATSHCQPLDVSIMAPFKHHLHDLWIAEDTIEHDEEDDQDWMSHTAHVKRTTMIKRAIMAWEKITPEQVLASDLEVLKKRLTTASRFDTTILDADSSIGKMVDNLMRALERDNQAWVLDQESKTVVDIMIKSIKLLGLQKSVQRQLALQRNKPLKSNVYRFLDWLRVQTAGYHLYAPVEDEKTSAPPERQPQHHRGHPSLDDLKAVLAVVVDLPAPRATQREVRTQEGDMSQVLQREPQGGKLPQVCAW
ncbi:hypothetical protein DYB31_012146 [Aphanomyces astaci]|uniref:DDE-1 domain-containing protein n=1 Tax=Aphanomyces astaci TaxID=112090 RepID=A0A397FJM8_APHAT|nr:hypothetical protein DYB31_012146 [Aphanomyces astaci]